MLENKYRESGKEVVKDKEKCIIKKSEQIEYFQPIFNYLNILKSNSHLRVDTLYGYPLAFEMVYFNGMFIKELKTYARILLL